jgi:hypothetical protein
MITLMVASGLSGVLCSIGRQKDWALIAYVVATGTFCVRFLP